MLTGEELLAGASLDFEMEIPDEILHPVHGSANKLASKVRMRPLSVMDLQLINRAAKENDNLVAALMIHRALIEPQMTVPQVSSMHVGLTQYLLSCVNEISGITSSAKQLDDAVEAPLTKAAYVLSKAFGWSPQQVGELTLGQMLLNLKMLKGDHGSKV